MTKHWAFHILIFAIFIAVTNARTEEIEHSPAQLALIPNKCVALSQGKVCYQNVDVSWHLQEIADVCLYERGDSKAMQCWRGINGASLSFRFAHTESKTYELRDAESGKVLVATSVEVKWVYKQRPGNRYSWRIF